MCCYCVCQNSWGVGWGDGGYVKIAMGAIVDCGLSDYFMGFGAWYAVCGVRCVAYGVWADRQAGSCTSNPPAH